MRRITIAALVGLAVGAPVAIALVSNSSSHEASAASPKDRIETASGVAARSAAIYGRKVRLAHQRALARARRREAALRAAAQVQQDAYANLDQSNEMIPAPPASGPNYRGGEGVPAELQSIAQCESGGDYNARNPSGAYGKYQIMPETASAYGCDLSTPGGQDACATKIYAGGAGRSQWVC